MSRRRRPLRPSVAPTLALMRAMAIAMTAVLDPNTTCANPAQTASTAAAEVSHRRRLRLVAQHRRLHRLPDAPTRARTRTTVTAMTVALEPNTARVTPAQTATIAAAAARADAYLPTRPQALLRTTRPTSPAAPPDRCLLPMPDRCHPRLPGLLQRSRLLLLWSRPRPSRPTRSLAASTLATTRSTAIATTVAQEASTLSTASSQQIATIAAHA